MNRHIEFISLKALQKVTYSMTLPVQLKNNEQLFICDELLRIVPAKRLVFMGRSAAKKVIIKLFVHAKKAKKHWQRERAGAELLNQHGIKSPTIIAQGHTEDGIYYLLFPFIEGQSLAHFWQQNDRAERQQKLGQLMPILAEHHQAGLVHQDVHYANFLLADSVEKDMVYTLDGEEVKKYPRALSKRQRLDNLALFLAQTFDITRKLSQSLLNDYAQLVDLSLSDKDIVRFWQQIKYQQQQRIKHYLKKMLRECTDVIYRDIIINNNKQGYSLVRREYFNNALEQLLNQPELFFQHKDSHFLKQGNTCTVKSVIVAGECYVLKRYNPKGIVYELSHTGQHSRARKSWLNAHLLRFMGINTPEPVALIEQQPALGQRCSYFICKFQPGQTSWDFFCDEQHCSDYKRQCAQQLLTILQRLNDYAITHGDLKGSNFLIHEHRVSLLDLDALQQHQFGWQFNKSWQRDKRRFLKNWAKKSCYKPWLQYFNQALSEQKMN